VNSIGKILQCNASWIVTRFALTLWNKSEDLIDMPPEEPQFPLIHRMAPYSVGLEALNLLIFFFFRLGFWQGEKNTMGYYW